MVLDKKVKIVLIIAAIVIIWLLSGLMKKPEIVEKTKIETQQIIPKSQDSQAILKDKVLKVTGTVKAKNYIKIASEVTGVVKEKLVEEGTQVKEGDLLFVVENQALLASVTSAESNLVAAELKYKAVEALFKKDLASKLQLEEAINLVNIAKAAVASSKAALSHTEIRAPFSGTLEEIFISKGEVVTNYPGGQNILAKIVNSNDDEIAAYLSSKERALLDKIGQEVIIEKDQVQELGKITFISKAADEATGTYMIKVKSNSNSNQWIDGETVIMKIKLGSLMAHKIPLSAVIIDSQGNLAIKRIESGKIITNKIDLVAEEEAALWITGIPEKSNIILVGHYYAEDR